MKVHLVGQQWPLLRSGRREARADHQQCGVQRVTLLFMDCRLAVGQDAWVGKLVC